MPLPKTTRQASIASRMCAEKLVKEGKMRPFMPMGPGAAVYGKQVGKRAGQGPMMPAAAMKKGG